MPKNPLDEVMSTEDAESLDRALRRDPRTLTDADLRELIEVMRRDRPRFISAAEKRRAKRAGENTEEPPADTEETSNA